MAHYYGGIIIDMNNNKEGLMSFVVINIIDNNINNRYRYVPLWYWLAFDRVMSESDDTLACERTPG